MEMSKDLKFTKNSGKIILNCHISYPNIRISVVVLVLLVLGIMLMPMVATAEVFRIEITSRETISGLPELIRSGDYEIIKGIIYLEVDPNNPANTQIVDLKLAPRNNHRNVEFYTEFELHKPVNANRGNHRLIYFVNNRGNKIGEYWFSRKTGMNWLYANGWSYLYCGWNCDVVEDENRFNIHVPVATENGKTITGKIYSEVISYFDELTFSLPLVWGGSIAYQPVNMDNYHAVLTKRQYRWCKAINIPNEGWSFARLENDTIVPDPGYLYIEEGFTPGWLYDLVYEGKNPKVTGLGMAAIRDVVSFFRYEKNTVEGSVNPLAYNIEYAFAWGHSQSARLLNHFIYQNFNGDEKQRIVFDGIFGNCPGSGKGLFNARFAQMTRHGSHHEDNLYPVDFFPFTTVEQYDPVKDERGDALALARRSGFLPKMVYLNTSTDYWTRAASLLHTDVEGKQDSEIDPNVRIYLVAGRAHGDGRSPIIGRALLVALDQWVSGIIDPPASRIPRISDSTLVSLEDYKAKFPSIPEITVPESFYHPYRLDPGPRWKKNGIADNVPPRVCSQFVCLVPQVNKDGNEIAGIRLPEIAVPLSTFTGWRKRNPEFSKTLRRNLGSSLPVSRTPEERQIKGDPRLSILERYPSKKDYMMEVSKCLLNLKSQRFLLDEDFARLFIEAAEMTYWPQRETPKVKIKKVSLQPAVTKVGDNVLFSVIFEGSIDEVFIVKAKIGNIQYTLNNDGKNGDEKANDNVWSCKGEVQPYFQSRQNHVSFLALDKNLNAIYLTGTVKEGMGEHGSLILTVKK